MFSLTWGLLPWLYQSEIFPTSIRAKANSLSTLSNWTWNAILAKSAPYLMESMGEKLYILLAVACLLMGVFVFFYVPETRGKSLEDMDEVFSKKVRDVKS